MVTQEITVEFPEPFAKPEPKEENETAVCPLCKKGWTLNEQFYGVPYEHSHYHNFKLKFLGQKSCLLNHAQASGLQYQVILIRTYHQYDWP